MINWRQSGYICSHVQWTQKPKVRLVYHALTDAIWLVCPRFVSYGRPKGNKPSQVLFRARFLLVPGKTKFGIMLGREGEKGEGIVKSIYPLDKGKARKSPKYYNKRKNKKIQNFNAIKL